jgi:thiamine-phosphate pyrophosphorylase
MDAPPAKGADSMAHPRFVPDGRTDLYGFASDVRTAADLLRAGLRVLQFRAKEMDDRRFREAAGAVLAEVRKFPGAVLIVNDRVDIALEIGADGVHVGPEDEPAEAVRARIPADFILGVSARTPERARTAERAGADYLGVGAVFSTTTKADAKTIGLED